MALLLNPDHLRFPNGLRMKQCQNIAEANAAATEYVCKASKLCWFQNRNDGFLGFPRVQDLNLAALAVKNHIRLKKNSRSNYASSFASALRISRQKVQLCRQKLWNQRKCKRMRRRRGEKKESAGSFSLKTMILAIADTVENKNAMLLLDFFLSMYCTLAL